MIRSHFNICFYIDSDNEIYYDKTDANTSANRNFDGTVRRIGAQLSFVHYLIN